jgi:hypothetical protein
MTAQFSYDRGTAFFELFGLRDGWNETVAVAASALEAAGGFETG